MCCWYTIITLVQYNQSLKFYKNKNFEFKYALGHRFFFSKILLDIISYFKSRTSIKYIRDLVCTISPPMLYIYMYYITHFKGEFFDLATITYK